ncbi:hypothetical protein M3M39_05060 [Fructilactobacillus hinvesii]|uniref:Phage protein n=1 Tax=Fructilactobacillus hinvesii TaxID=2940300 RepID=A0ABY5BV02_9LACO|nr:hypothetical protein [Fructilactobacillus hinvesii]USS87493.1 hypothetical protein M3M39_05060 [Fructilactobacillus hinvesii]
MSDKKIEPFLEVKLYSGEDKKKSFAFVKVENANDRDLALNIVSTLLEKIATYSHARDGVIALLVDVLGITDDDYKKARKRVDETNSEEQVAAEAEAIIKKQKGEI